MPDQDSHRTSRFVMLISFSRPFRQTDASVVISGASLVL